MYSPLVVPQIYFLDGCIIARGCRDLLQGVVRGWHDRLPGTVNTVKVRLSLPEHGSATGCSRPRSCFCWHLVNSASDDSICTSPAFPPSLPVPGICCLGTWLSCLQPRGQSGWTCNILTEFALACFCSGLLRTNSRVRRLYIQVSTSRRQILAVHPHEGFGDPSWCNRARSILISPLSGTSVECRGGRKRLPWCGRRGSPGAMPLDLLGTEEAHGARWVTLVVLRLLRAKTALFWVRLLAPPKHRARLTVGLGRVCRTEGSVLLYNACTALLV